MQKKKQQKEIQKFEAQNKSIENERKKNYNNPF